MTFKRKLQKRLYIYLCYLFIGLSMLIAQFIIRTENDLLSGMGLAFVVCAIAKIRKYFTVLRNETLLKQQEIKENDERNIFIMNSAKSIAFNIYIILNGIVIVALSFANKSELVNFLSYNICVVVLIYWLSYFFVKKRF